jgi:hypothetical protein
MTTAEITRKNIPADVWLFIAVSIYFIMNGAQLWETAIMIPAWTQAPPASLIFFQEPYGLDFKMFWIVVHSIHDLTLIVALILNWKVPRRRRWMIPLVILHVGVRVWTLLYFAPVIIEFQQIPYSDTVDPALVEKAAQWRELNYLRVGLFFLVNLALVPLLNPFRNTQI